MSNCVMIGYPNRATAASYSGGGWIAGLPAANMGTKELYQVARSTTAAEADTVVNVDLGIARPLRAFALVNHNLSESARWRVTLGTTAGAADVFDSGIKPAWSMTFEGLVEWESVSWWSGVSGDEYLRSPYAAMLALPDTYHARYLTVSILDAGNSDGYIQVGRLFAGGAIQPQYGAQYGLQDSWRDLSTVEQAESGAAWATERRRLRSTSFVLGYLSHIETAYFHELQRLVGTVSEVLYMPYPDDPGQSQRYGFLGRLSELSAIDYPYYRARSLPLKIEELV